MSTSSSLSLFFPFFGSTHVNMGEYLHWWDTLLLLLPKLLITLVCCLLDMHVRERNFIYIYISFHFLCLMFEMWKREWCLMKIFWLKVISTPFVSILWTSECEQRNYWMHHDFQYFNGSFIFVRKLWHLCHFRMAKVVIRDLLFYIRIIFNVGTNAINGCWLSI